MRVFAEVLWRSIASGVVIIAESLFVQRRPLIVRIGRGFQRTLHLPRCLCAFTECDPGITKNALRRSSVAIMGTSVFFSLFVALPFCSIGRAGLQNRILMVFAMINPVFCSIIVWIVLAIKKPPETEASCRQTKDLEQAPLSWSVEDYDEFAVENNIKSIWSETCFW
ncbi:hypothetical protein F4808DRAFT_457423 [Astrocystis sublimbata]|nr:hypothetical protein F4808DRAFT_457423 [Astrocystis sublimbata]